MRLTKVTEGGRKVSSTIAHDPIGRATAIKRPYDVSGKDPAAVGSSDYIPMSYGYDRNGNRSGGARSAPRTRRAFGDLCSGPDVLRQRPVHNAGDE